jgi:N-acetylglucosamine malate deacetylase 1
MKPQRILLLVPHPDDEVVGCAVALKTAIAAGAQVFAIYLTTGVPAREALWPWQRPGHGDFIQRRLAEAREVAGVLGLHPIVFQPWPSRSLRSHLADAMKLVEAAIAEHRIDELWAPAWEGAHQDHDAANLLASRFEAKIRTREFAEYNFMGGKVRSGVFAHAAGNEETRQLTEEESSWKRSLIARYESERGNLAHIKAQTESLRDLPAHDYGKPPHEGRLFWTRFHWVPFRHPRVDFDRPEDVYGALARFTLETPARQA